MHDVFAYSAAHLAADFPDWRYAREFSEACEKDGGIPRETISAAESRISCEKDGLPYWEFIEGYADVLPTYQGPLLNKEYTVLYRAIATALRDQ